MDEAGVRLPVGPQKIKNRPKYRAVFDLEIRQFDGDEEYGHAEQCHDRRPGGRMAVMAFGKKLAGTDIEEETAEDGKDEPQ